MTKSDLQAGQRTFRLTKPKRGVLRLLSEYYCLRTNDLAESFHQRKPTQSDQRGMRRTLSLLLKAGLVNRLPYFDLEQERGGISYVWGLSDRGTKDSSGKSFDEHSVRTLDHELEISFFHLAIKRFCESNGLLLYWQQKELKRTIHPDALFAISDPRKPQGADTNYFFLEIERSKMGHYRNGEPQILKKLGKYYDYFNSTDCEKEWGDFWQFRVVIVQRTDERRKHLLQALAEKHKHRMFWLTIESLSRQSIGSEIFKTPKDYESKSYGFLDI